MGRQAGWMVKSFHCGAGCRSLGRAGIKVDSSMSYLTPFCAAGIIAPKPPPTWREHASRTHYHPRQVLLNINELFNKIFALEAFREMLSAQIVQEAPL